MRLLACLGLLLLLALPAAAHDYRAGPLRVEHPWARATIGKLRMTAGFLVVVNEGTTPDRLLAVEIPGAMMVQLHVTENGMMRAIESFEVPAGGRLEVVPGGHHLMIGPLEAPLLEGERLPGTLVFEQAGALEVEFLVEPASTTNSH